MFRIRSKDQQQQQVLLTNQQKTAATDDSDHSELEPPVANCSPVSIAVNSAELHSKIDSLTGEIRDLREKIMSASAKVRSVPYGQDRYYRNYWVLQNAGGILIESLEAGSPFDPSADPHGGPNLESEVRFCLDRMVDVVERKFDTYEFKDHEEDDDTEVKDHCIESRCILPS